MTPGPGAAGALRPAYARLLAQQGHQDWWPAETDFEICVGAILTQNTQWTNVERAIARLKAAKVLEPAALFDVPEGALAELVRPAGCPTIKARRLRAFLQVLVRDFGGELERMLAGPKDTLRSRLLAIHGIGPETADCLVLYAGRLASFVVDAYTRRIFSRHGWCASAVRYDALQALCARAFAPAQGEDCVALWQDCHAQLVEVGKRHCRPGRPKCGECPLAPWLPAR